MNYTIISQFSVQNKILLERYKVIGEHVIKVLISQDVGLHNTK